MHAALPDALGLCARCMHAHLVSLAVPMGAQYILYLPRDHADCSLFSAHMSLHMFCSLYYVNVTSHFIFTCQTLCLVYKCCNVHSNVIFVVCLHFLCATLPS